MTLRRLHVPRSVVVATLAAVCSLVLLVPARASARSSDEARCVLEVNRLVASLSRTLGREQLRCLRRKASGKETEADACRFQDPRGRLAKAREKAGRGEAKKCSTTPAFGHAGSEAAGEAATDASWGLVGDLLGSDVDGTIAPRSDKPASKCQAELLKRSHALLDTIWKEVHTAKKAALSGAPPSAASRDELEAAILASLGSSKKLAKRAVALASGAEKRCGGRGDLADLFPGECAGEGAAELAACAERRVRCRACRAVNAADVLQLDCDAFDDGAMNSSCPWKTPPTVTLELEEASAARGVLGSEGGSLAATGSDGTTYTLQVPAGALREDVEIGVIPVASIAGLPAGALLAAVQLEPEGLRFWALGGATLTLELPASAPELFGFGWEGAGERLYLQPKRVDGATVSFDVLHFSGAGVATRNLDLEDVRNWFHSSYERDAQEALEIALNGLGINAQPMDPAFIATLLDILRRWYRNGVIPQLYGGLTAPAFYERGVSEAVSFLSTQLELGILNGGLFGLPSDPLATENTRIRELIEAGFLRKVETIVAVCLANEDARTFVLEAADHESLNAALDLLPPPPDARPGAFLPFFEGRCIEVAVLEVEYPESMARGRCETITIWTGWSGPSGAVKHDAFPVGVDVDVIGGSVDVQDGLASPLDGRLDLAFAMESDAGAQLTLYPHLERVLFGDAFTVEIAADPAGARGVAGEGSCGGGARFEENLASVHTRVPFPSTSTADGFPRGGNKDIDSTSTPPPIDLTSSRRLTEPGQSASADASVAVALRGGLGAVDALEIHLSASGSQTASESLNDASYAVTVNAEAGASFRLEVDLEATGAAGSALDLSRVWITPFGGGALEDAYRLYQSAIDGDTTDAYVVEGTFAVSGRYGLEISISAHANSPSPPASSSVDARVDATWTFFPPAAP